jgi:hypothetical protein
VLPPPTNTASAFATASGTPATACAASTLIRSGAMASRISRV